ncbi:MAG: ABC transporter permease [Anaerolineae bacterium]
MAVRIIHQIITTSLTLWVAITLTFFALRLLPGNAIDAQLQGAGLPSAVIEARKASLGFDQPVLIQYGLYMSGLFTGDWGQSLYTGQTVLEVLRVQAPTTVALAIYAITLATILGVLLGLLAGSSHRFASLAQMIVNLSLSIPIYVTATLLLFLVAANSADLQRNLLLPVLTLGFHTAGAIARMIEVTHRDLQSSPFIATARAKGLPTQHILTRHMLALTLLPAIPVIGVQAGVLFSGAVLTEAIFGQSGLGVLLLNATFQRDYPIVQGIIVLTTFAYIVVNQLAQMMAHLLDPRLTR